MAIKNTLQTVALTRPDYLHTLVENRTAYTLAQCELNVFETHQQSYLVPLTFNDFVVTSMLRGKKVMHLYDKMGFDYLPGESVIVPPNVTMKIDFPEASNINPTQCIALAIEGAHIAQTLQYLNEKFPREPDASDWQLNYNECHFYNNEEIAFLINKLIRICSSAAVGKDILADLTLKELLVRIIQSQALNASANSHYSQLNHHPLAYIIGYIKTNIQGKITIDDLSSKACMSKPNFYRVFKRQFGMSPLEYILHEKMNRAKSLLETQNLSVSEICYECGFNDVNYFIRMFKKMQGITPGQYQARARKV